MSYTKGDEFDYSLVSECCGATMYADIGICSECKEHCDGVNPDEFEDGTEYIVNQDGIIQDV